MMIEQGSSLQSAGLRRWQWIHRWSSLVCTLFLLIICLTGLPLIFSEEIDHLVDPPAPYATMPSNTAHMSLDHLVGASQKMFPGHVISSIVADDVEPQVYVWLVPSFADFKADRSVAHFVRFDSRTGHILDRSKSSGDYGNRFLGLMLRLHMDLFAGLPGELFMGSMGILFVLAIASGIILYGPYTRRLKFGQVRWGRGRRIRWLDLHNLLGATALAWMSVVGATGAMNELARPLFMLWQKTDVAMILAPYEGKKPLESSDLASPQQAFDEARRAVPGMVVTNIVFPGSLGGSPYHYLIWAKGSSPLTSQLLSPVLVDARTGKLTAVLRMPWYLRAIEISRPLHFGDYGGLPLKIIWALLDVVTIIVLVSGVYLWIGKRPSSTVTVNVISSHTLQVKAQ